MKIGVDVDGDLYDFVESYRDYAVESRGFERADLVWTQYDPWDPWGISQQTFLDIFAEGVAEGRIFRTGRPIAGSVAGLRRLRAARHTIHLVTHRNEHPRAIRSTGEWLVEHGVPYDTLTFAKDKTLIPVDVFLEDSTVNYDAILAAGGRPVLFDQPWNQDSAGGVTRIRVGTWSEFVDFVALMEREQKKHPLVSQADKPARHPNSQRFHDLLAEMGALHDKKQSDYGRGDDPFANVRSSTEWGLPAWVGAMVRLNDKVRRLQTLRLKGSLANEAAVDSFMDIAVYSVIARVLFDQENATD